jgi:hypothetical protein
MTAVDVSGLSSADRIGSALQRSLPMLAPEAQREIEKLIEPETLAIVAGVLVAWVVSHFIGIGEIVSMPPLRSTRALGAGAGKAETVAQVGVNGLRSAFRGVSFPVQQGYVILLREVLVNGKTIRPFLPELGGVCAGGFIFGGIPFEFWWSPTPPKATDGTQ